MKTLTVTIDDETYAHIESDARVHARTVEDEVVERCKPVDWSKRPLIRDRDELLRAVQEFHKDMGREVSLTPEEMKSAITEGRE